MPEDWDSDFHNFSKTTVFGFDFKTDPAVPAVDLAAVTARQCRMQICP